MLGGRQSSPLSDCYRRTLPSQTQRFASSALLVGLVFTAWLRLTPYAHAASVQTDVSSPASVPDSLPTVEIQVIGDSARRRALENVLGSQHAGRAIFEWTSATRFDPQQVFEPAPAAKAKIRCWINLSDPNLARLYFVAPRQDRFMLRELPLNRRFGSFEIESLAQIVELSVDALLTDEDAGISRVQAQAILAPPVPRITSPTPPKEPIPRVIASGSVHAVAISARYELTRYSAEIPLQHGFGVSLAHEREGRMGVQQLAIAAAYSWPSDVRDEVASATIRGGSLSLRLAQLWRLDKGRHQHVGLGLTGGLLWLGAKASAGTLPGEYVVQQREARTLEPFVGPVGVWRVNLARRLSIQLACIVGWYPSPIRHEFIVNGQSDTLTLGATIRPSLNVELVVH